LRRRQAPGGHLPSHRSTDVTKTIRAESSALTPDDVRKQKIAAEFVQSQNIRLIDVAKQLVTICFSAVGIVLTLKEKWLGASPSVTARTALGVAIVLYLSAAVLTMLAAGAYRHRITTSDYGEVDAELQRVATIRYWLTSAGFCLILVATVIISVVATSY
jgi:hypothetical protein